MKLGVDNTFSDSSVLVMAGGTLDAGTFTDTMASLNLVSDSTLELGTGHLTFGNSTGYTWSGTLELTGTLGDTTLRFVPNLTSDQLARISYYGNSVAGSKYSRVNYKLLATSWVAGRVRLSCSTINWMSILTLLTSLTLLTP
jgi:hypothetical protein